MNNHVIGEAYNVDRHYREMNADQAVADWIFSQKVSDLQNMLAGLRKNKEARRLSVELEDIVDQAITCLSRNASKVSE